MHTIKNNYFFVPKLKTLMGLLKVHVLVTQQFSSTKHWPLLGVHTSNSLQFAKHKALFLQEAPMVHVFTQTSKSYQNKHWGKGKVKGPRDERSKWSK